MKFEHQYDETSPKITFELDRDMGTVEVVEAFVHFMVACGHDHDNVKEMLITILEQLDE